MSSVNEPRVATEGFTDENPRSAAASFTALPEFPNLAGDERAQREDADDGERSLVVTDALH